MAASTRPAPAPESAPSNAVTPAARRRPARRPRSRAAGEELRRAGQLDRARNDGGSPITGYKITPYLGRRPLRLRRDRSAAATSGHVAALTNGATYTFKVAAINAVGTGADSAASAAVTPYDTIFDLATPATVDVDDPGSVNLGVKFQSDVAGQGHRHPLLQGGDQHRHPRR